MAKEIERKFLVMGGSWRQARGVVYCQGYLNTDQRRTVRIRTIGQKGYLTIKGETVRAPRWKFEYEIPVEEARQMLSDLCERPIIHKTRYKIEHEGLTWEIDEFAEENRGLILAEVALPTEDHPFVKPEWIGSEVTSDPRYFNANLVQHPYNEWQEIEKKLADCPKTACTAMLNALQKQTYQYFIHEVNPDNGLIADKSGGNCPASIAATGFALTTYPVVVEDGLLNREEATQRTLKTLRFFWHSAQSEAPDASGYKGFYYHFLDMKDGRRAQQSELSTVDTTLLVAGMLFAAQYFNRETAVETEIRDLADKLYRRIDWQWALDGGTLVKHAWMPEKGFLSYEWEGYDESIPLYILGLGSPTHPLDPASYQASVAKYSWKTIYGYEYIYAGPLFIHQFPHIWIDFRGIQDDYTRQKGIDYFENSRRATYIQQEYAIRNPLAFDGYGQYHWGFTASDGPGPHTMEVDEIERIFFDYIARGVPYGPDDGTVAPWSVVASLPFAPEIVLPTIKKLNALELQAANPYGYKATINQTFPQKNGQNGWVSPYHYGINQGPIVMMIENYQTEMISRLMKQCPSLVNGLQLAGFKVGWLET
jgi:CYTH domain-containing protein